MGKVKKPKLKPSKTFVPKKHENVASQVKNQIFSFSSNTNNLKKDKSGEVKSVLSYKSAKSHKPVNKTTRKIIKKKDKLTLKRKLLIKKIDVVNEMKRKTKIREKRKNTSLIGDTNPLRDALPSLESLLKRKSDVTCKLPKQPKRKKGIEKARQRKQKLISDMDIFKRAIKDKVFKSNPFEIISNHIQAMVEKERSKTG